MGAIAWTAGTLCGVAFPCGGRGGEFPQGEIFSRRGSIKGWVRTPYVWGYPPTGADALPRPGFRGGLILILTLRVGLAIDGLRSTEGLECTVPSLAGGASKSWPKTWGRVYVPGKGELEALRGLIPEPDGPIFDHSDPIQAGGRPDTFGLRGGIPGSGTKVVLRSAGVGRRSRDVCALGSPEFKLPVGAGFLVTIEG